MKLNNCEICIMGLLEFYPTKDIKREFVKCPICGFTKRCKMEYLTVEMLLMGRDKIYPAEYTDELKKNALDIVAAVNNFLTDLKWESKTSITSGWRPSVINSATPNAAKKSLHQTCQAVDILDDKDQTLGKKCKEYPELLRKWGLFLENPDFTKGKNTNWVHLDISRTRPDRQSRMFNP